MNEDSPIISEVYMAKAIVSLIDQEVDRYMRALIDAEAQLAAQQIRVSYEKKENEENYGGGFGKRNEQENLKRFEVSRDAISKQFKRWQEIQRYAVNTFLIKIK